LPQDVVGLSTGFHDFDKLTSGLRPGQLIIIAARPAMGKTSLFLSAGQNIAMSGKSVVAIFSLEMPGPQLATRFLSSTGRLDQNKIRTGRLTDDDWDKMTNALGKLHEAPIHIDETGAINATDLRARNAPRQEQWQFRRGQLLKLAQRDAEAAVAFERSLAAIQGLPPGLDSNPAMVALARNTTAELATIGR
jgi:replicative DNA helicase